MATKEGGEQLSIATYFRSSLHDLKNQLSILLSTAGSCKMRCTGSNLVTTFTSKGAKFYAHHDHNSRTVAKFIIVFGQFLASIVVLKILT